MKLEMEHVLGVQSPPRKSYNPFDSDDEIEATNGYAKSNVNGYDIKSFETNADSLTFHLDNSDDVSWEEAIVSHSQILRQSNPADSKDEEVLSRKDTELFTDKTVTECDLPELMVCYKENAFHTVKDIGIDEGMPVRDKNGSENTPAFPGLDGDINGDEHLNISSFTEGLKSRSENDFEEDVTFGKLPQDSAKHSDIDEFGTADSTSLDEVKLDLSNEKSNFSMDSVVDVVDTGGESVSSRDPQLDEKSDSIDPKIEKKDQVVCEEHVDNKSSLEKSHESSTMTSKTDTSETSTESNESVYEEATSSLLSPDLSLPQEPSEKGVTNVLSYNSKVESGSIVLDFNSATETAKEKEEETSQQIKTVAEPPEAQLMSRIDEERVLDSDNRVIGETSFSAAMAPPSSITYMGPYAQSGNISLRSESSCGSTRSFAFPVLQAEWNSSPVRMAKAEHRNRKQRWVHSIMCCRF